MDQCIRGPACVGPGPVVRTFPLRKDSGQRAEELMLLNCGADEDS